MNEIFNENLREIGMENGALYYLAVRMRVGVDSNTSSIEQLPHKNKTGNNNKYIFFIILYFNRLEFTNLNGEKYKRQIWKKHYVSTGDCPMYYMRVAQDTHSTVDKSRHRTF